MSDERQHGKQALRDLARFYGEGLDDSDNADLTKLTESNRRLSVRSPHADADMNVRNGVTTTLPPEAQDLDIWREKVAPPPAKESDAQPSNDDRP